MSLPGVGERNSLPDRRGSFQSRKLWIDGGIGLTGCWSQLERAVEWLWMQLGQDGINEHFAYEPLSLLYTFVINIVALTVCFLISLPFPVNSTRDLCLLCLQFSTASHCSGKGAGNTGLRESSNVVLKSLLVGTEFGSTIPNTQQKDREAFIVCKEPV